MSAEISVASGVAEIAFRNETPWHGLGQKVSPDQPVEIWAQAAHLTWNVRKEPVSSPSGTCAGWNALVRDDIDQALWVVRDRYQVVQPRQLLDFFHALRDEGVEMETLGALQEGRVIWGLGKIPGTVTLRGDDEVNQFLLFATSYDYTMSTIVRRTTVRVVCANTLEAAMNRGTTYTRTSHAKMFDFQGALAATRNALTDKAPFEQFTYEAQRLAQRIISREEMVAFFTNVLWPTATPAEIQENSHAQRRLAQLVNIAETAPGQTVSSARNTAWGAINAVTYLVDHVRGRSQETRLQSALFSDGRTLKERAWGQGLALAA